MASGSQSIALPAASMTILHLVGRMTAMFLAAGMAMSKRCEAAGLASRYVADPDDQVAVVAAFRFWARLVQLYDVMQGGCRNRRVGNVPL